MPKIRYKTAVNPLENSVFTGFGETKLDMKTIAKDVPCQNACPGAYRCAGVSRPDSQGQA